MERSGDEVKQIRVCVVGAGVVGLTTATLLQEARPDIHISIIADRFTTETVSDVAAGLYRPSANSLHGPDRETTCKWAKDSYNHYKKLLSLPNATAIGIKALESIALSSTEEHIVKNEILEEICPIYRKLTDEELKSYPGGNWKYGIFFKTLLTENRYYLPYLMNIFKERGGVIKKRKVSSLVELSGEFDAVMNCSGLGAKFICGDTSLTPIRGQVFKVKAPWIKRCMYIDSDCYIIPGIDYITLGGCRQFDSWNMEVNRHDSDAIWERCLKAMPSLRNAEIVTERVGLRPYRSSVRVETEHIKSQGGKTLKVVHNYGHGGYGVCFAPGTSMEAVKLIQEMLPLHLPPKL